MLTIKEYLDKAKKWKSEKKNVNFGVNPANYTYLQEFTEKHEFPTQGQALDYIFGAFKSFFDSKGEGTTGELQAKLTTAQQAQEKAEQEAATLKEQVTEKDSTIETLTGQKEKYEQGVDKMESDLKSVLDKIDQKYPELDQFVGTVVEQPADLFEMFSRMIEYYKKQAEAANKVAQGALTDREDFKKLKDELETTLPKLFPGKLTVTDRVPVSDEIMVSMLIEHALTDKNSVFPTRRMAEQAVKEYLK